MLHCMILGLRFVCVLLSKEFAYIAFFLVDHAEKFEKIKNISSQCDFLNYLLGFYEKFEDLLFLKNN